MSKVTLVGVDFGRGETEAVVDEKRECRFPSVVSRTVDRRFGQLAGLIDTNGHVRVWLTKRDGHTMEVDRMVGQDAMEQSMVARAELAQERKDEDIVALVAESFLKLGVTGPTKLVVGAPVDYYNAVKAKWVVECRAINSIVVEDRKQGDSIQSVRKHAKEKDLVVLFGRVKSFVDGKKVCTYVLEDASGEIEVRLMAPNHIANPVGKWFQVQGHLFLEGRYRDLLCGEWNINGSTTVEVLDVEVLPEPVGAVYHEALTFDGKVKDRDLLRGTLGIIDIGMFTTDFVVFTDRVFREPLSFSVQIGVAHILQRISRHLLEKAGKDIEYFRLDMALRERQVSFGGKPFRLGEVIDAAVEEVAESILSNVITGWDRVMGMKQVLLAGGGAYYLGERIVRELPIVKVVPDPEWAIARGFRAFAYFRFRD